MPTNTMTSSKPLVFTQFQRMFGESGRRPTRTDYDRIELVGNRQGREMEMRKVISI